MKRLISCALVTLGFSMGAPLAAEPASTSNVGLTSCSSPNEALGTGITLSKVCTVSVQTSASFPDYYDAYYSVRATLQTRPAFIGVGNRLDRSAGEVIGRIVEKLFGVKQGKKLSIGYTAKLGGQEYPIQSLVSFSRDDRGTWTVTTNGMGETLLHRITAIPGAEVSLGYFYSNRADVNLNAGRDLIGAAVPWVASPAADPVFALAGKVTETIYDAGSQEANNRPTRTLKPSFGDPVLVQFDIKDPSAKRPDQAQLIATITVELRGTRSLLRDTGSFDQLADTLPRDGAIDAPKLGQLANYVFAGTPAKWPAVYTMLAGMGASAPFGVALKEADVASFCSSADGAIRNTLPLSFGDATLLKATMLDVASAAIKDKVNPFSVCFDASTKTMIKAKLGIDTGYNVVAPPAPGIVGYKSKQLLRTLAAWFVSKSCSQAEIDNSPLADYVADKVEIGPRDNLPSGSTIDALNVPPPPDNSVSRDAFLKATCGSFPFWNTLSDATGTFQVDQVDSKTGWRVTGSLTGDKISSFSVVKL